jgi:hypothetical protein
MVRYCQFKSKKLAKLTIVMYYKYSALPMYGKAFFTLQQDSGASAPSVRYTEISASALIIHT